MMLNKPQNSSRLCTMVYSHPKRDFTYHQPQNLDNPPPASFITSTGPPSTADFSAVLRSCRNSSAPGPNVIPNVIWKRCPSLQLQKRLYSVVVRVWNTCQILLSWKHAAIRLIQKSGSASDPAQQTSGLKRQKSFLRQNDVLTENGDNEPPGLPASHEISENFRFWWALQWPAAFSGPGKMSLRASAHSTECNNTPVRKLLRIRQVGSLENY